MTTTHKFPSQRAEKLWRTYHFQCGCLACTEKWKQREEIPDVLARIPNWEQEKCFVIRHGDKKDICDEITNAKWIADFGLTSDSFAVAQEALDAMCLTLNKHVRRPHARFVEAFDMVEKLAISQYVGFTMTELAQIEEEVKVTKKAKTVKAGQSEGTRSVKLARGTGNGTLNNGHQPQAVEEEGNSWIEDGLKAIPVENTENGQEAVPSEEHVDAGPASTPKFSAAGKEADPSPPQPEEEVMGTSKLIKAFEGASPSPAAVKRPQSPTLRLFTTPPDAGKKSVLERFDDAKFNNRGENL